MLPPWDGDYSESTAWEIDNELQEIISKEYDKALTILKEKKAVLIKGAHLLLEKEKIDSEELKAHQTSRSQTRKRDRSNFEITGFHFVRKPI